ncbi:hypothetical protein EES42_41595 [Streptomyces sp. ADI95-17]|nr:hypothetical protein EES42_41595 [Streptomyces sp. ADI95-17]
MNGRAKMPIRLVYETHANTIDNEAGIATVWLPGVLSPAKAADRPGNSATAVATTASRRCSPPTCTAPWTPRGSPSRAPVPIHQDRRLPECNYGRLNGHPQAALAPLQGRHIDEPFPGG